MDNKQVTKQNFSDEPQPVSRLTKEEHKNVAITIMQQLGGHKFMVMTGVKHYFLLSDQQWGGLQLRFKGCRHANTLRVIVDQWDTYTVEFWKITPAYVEDQKPLKVYEHVYDDMLRSIFEEYTGLKTSLGTLGG